MKERPCIPPTRRARRCCCERGSATLELTVLAPALLVLLGLVVVAARIESAAAALESAGAAGARVASLSRSAAAAQAGAEAAVRRNLADQGVACRDLRVALDLAAFRLPVGQHGAVRVVVRCRISLSDQAVPGLPGSRDLEAEAVSPLDTYRGRR